MLRCYHHRLYYFTGEFQHSGEGGPKAREADKRINIHKGQQSIPEQKYIQILSASHMG